MDLETVLGLLPALAMIVVAVLGLTWGAGLLHWLRAGPGAAGAAAALRPWLVPYALIGAGAIAFVVFGRRLQPRLRSRWLGGLVAIDLVVFTILGVVAVLPGLGARSVAVKHDGFCSAYTASTRNACCQSSSDPADEGTTCTVPGKSLRNRRPPRRWCGRGSSE